MSVDVIASLRPSSGSRERYPEWTVSRTERLVPSRRCKQEALGEDGKRSYSFLSCVNGCGVDVKVCSDFLKQHKNQAIEDHLCICEAVDEADRPAKVPRGGVSASTLRDPAKAALVPALHQRCDERFDAVTKQMQAVKDELCGVKDELCGVKVEVRDVKMENQMIRGIIDYVVPGVIWPIKSPAQLENAIQARFLPAPPTALADPRVDPRDELHGDRDLARCKEKFTISERDLLTAKKALRVERVLHKACAATCEDYAGMLPRIDQHLQTVFAELEARVGTERTHALFAPVVEEMAGVQKRRRQHADECTRSLGAMNDSDSE